MRCFVGPRASCHKSILQSRNSRPGSCTIARLTFYYCFYFFIFIFIFLYLFLSYYFTNNQVLTPAVGYNPLVIIIIVILGWNEFITVMSWILGPLLIPILLMLAGTSFLSCSFFNFYYYFRLLTETSGSVKDNEVAYLSFSFRYRLPSLRRSAWGTHAPAHHQCGRTHREPAVVASDECVWLRNKQGWRGWWSTI